MGPEPDPVMPEEPAAEGSPEPPAVPPEGWELHAVMGGPGDRKVVLAVPGQQHAWIGAQGERIPGSAYRLHSINASAAGGWVRLVSGEEDERPIRIYRDGRKEYERVDVQHVMGAWTPAGETVGAVLGAPATPASGGTPGAAAHGSAAGPATPGPSGVTGVTGADAGAAGAGSNEHGAGEAGSALGKDQPEPDEMVESHQLDGLGSAIRYVAYVDFDGFSYARLEVERGGVATGLLKKAGDAVADSDYQISEVRPEYLVLRSRNRSSGVRLHRTSR